MWEAGECQQIPCRHWQWWYLIPPAPAGPGWNSTWGSCHINKAREGKASHILGLGAHLCHSAGNSSIWVNSYGCVVAREPLGRVLWMLNYRGGIIQKQSHGSFPWILYQHPQKVRWIIFYHIEHIETLSNNEKATTCLLIDVLVDTCKRESLCLLGLASEKLLVYPVSWGSYIETRHLVVTQAISESKTKFSDAEFVMGLMSIKFLLAFKSHLQAFLHHFVSSFSIIKLTLLIYKGTGRPRS